LVKYGLQSPTYDLHGHIGGRHSVLYFSIQATEKYSTAMYYVEGDDGLPEVRKTGHWEIIIASSCVLQVPCERLWHREGRLAKCKMEDSLTSCLKPFHLLIECEIGGAPLSSQILSKELLTKVGHLASLHPRVFHQQMFESSQTSCTH